MPFENEDAQNLSAQLINLNLGCPEPSLQSEEQFYMPLSKLEAVFQREELEMQTCKSL